MELPTTRATDYTNDVGRLYMLAAKLVQLAGGSEWLAAAMDREPSYSSKIREALSGTGERKFHLEMLAPLLRDPDAADFLMTALSEWLEFEPPVRVKRDVTPEAYAQAVKETMAEMDPEYAAIQKRKIAKRLGVRVEDL